MNEQGVRKLFKEVMDKEAERNTKDKSRSHPYSEICSCERCHTANILATAMARPSIIQGIATYQLGSLFKTVDEHGKTLTVGNSPDEALKKWDEYFLTGKI